MCFVQKNILLQILSYLVNAVMYKASANILNSSLFSDRYNDLIVYKKRRDCIRIAQLDSSLNGLPTDFRIRNKGFYQLEIIKINDKLKEIVKTVLLHLLFQV